MTPIGKVMLLICYSPTYSLLCYVLNLAISMKLLRHQHINNFLLRSGNITEKKRENIFLVAYIYYRK